MSIEEDMLNRLLLDASKHKSAAVYLRHLALRGWIDMIHSGGKERQRELRTLGLPQEFIDLIEATWSDQPNDTSRVKNKTVEEKNSPKAALSNPVASPLGSADDALS